MKVAMSYIIASMALSGAMAKKKTRFDAAVVDPATKKLRALAEGDDKESADDTENDCPLECPVDLFYFYREGGNYHENFIKDPPGSCALAAIFDTDTLAAAVYAMPPHKVAITQGYFPIHDYLDECYFDGSGKEEIVENCHSLYNKYFVNYDGTDVLSDYDSWIKLDYPIKSGLLIAAVSSGDGKLRPVPSWNVGNSTVTPTAWDGAIYQCCPGIPKYCVPEVPKNATR